MKNDDWHNNLISKRLDEEFPHDFSICDIDGAIRVFWNRDNKYYRRLVIYESKFVNEKVSQTQLQTLFLLKDLIDWDRVDPKSGVFLIFHDKEAEHLSINEITQGDFHKCSWHEKEKMTIDEFYNWISAQDKRKKGTEVNKEN